MGFDTQRFVCKVADDRKCSMCHLVLDNPVRTPCAHVFCSGCILPWVVRNGCCPFQCQTVTTGDLDNVIALRESVLTMKVVCDYKDSGCTDIVRLVDLDKHTRSCKLRPMECRNAGCGVKMPFMHLARHEVFECDSRPVGVCSNGCEQILLFNNSEGHNCVDSLKARVAQHEDHIARLEEEIIQLTNRCKKKEKELATNVARLQTKLHVQMVTYQNQLRDYESQLSPGNNNKCDSTCGEDAHVRLVLERVGGTLGFNIMGGFVANTNIDNRNNNNNNNNQKEGMVTEGIIVSKVVDGGPAHKKGLQNHDQVIQLLLSVPRAGLVGSFTVKEATVLGENQRILPVYHMDITHENDEIRTIAGQDIPISKLDIRIREPSALKENIKFRSKHVDPIRV